MCMHRYLLVNAKSEKYIHMYECISVLHIGQKANVRQPTPKIKIVKWLKMEKKPYKWHNSKTSKGEATTNKATDPACWRRRIGDGERQLDNSCTAVVDSSSGNNNSNHYYTLPHIRTNNIDEMQSNQRGSAEGRQEREVNELERKLNEVKCVWVGRLVVYNTNKCEYILELLFLLFLSLLFLLLLLLLMLLLLWHDVANEPRWSCILPI